MTLDDLATQIRATFPDAAVRIDRFPSGAAMMDVVHLGTLFVVEHRPGEGYGLSVIEDDAEGFLSGHPLTDVTIGPIADGLMRGLERLATSRAKAHEGPSRTRRMVV